MALVANCFKDCYMDLAIASLFYHKDLSYVTIVMPNFDSSRLAVGEDLNFLVASCLKAEGCFADQIGLCVHFHFNKHPCRCYKVQQKAFYGAQWEPTYTFLFRYLSLPTCFAQSLNFMASHKHLFS